MFSVTVITSDYDKARPYAVRFERNGHTSIKGRYASRKSANAKARKVRAEIADAVAAYASL